MSQEICIREKGWIHSLDLENTLEQMALILRNISAHVKGNEIELLKQQKDSSSMTSKPNVPLIIRVRVWNWFS